MENIENEKDQIEEDTGPELPDIKSIKKKGSEIDQLYCVHLMLKYAWKGNFGAPVQDLLSSNSGVKVLDVGCGSGFWTLEMATEFPLPKFYGVDSTPTFPESVLPENVEFKVSDILIDGLPFKDAEFDYVFVRNIMFTFQKPNFESIVMKEILRVTKPGGYIEMVEEEITEGYNRGEALVRWNVNGLKPWLESQNIDYEIIYRFKDYLINTNQLKDVTEQKLKIQIGRCNGFIGELYTEHAMHVIKSMADKLIPIMKLTQEEYHNLIEEIEKDDEKNAYVWYRRFFAMKM